MRLLIATLLACVALWRPALAQTYGTPVLSGGAPALPSALSGLASLPCPTVFGGWSFCNSVQQWTQLYNQLQAVTNQAAEMQRNIARYATYPQKLQGNVQGDLANVERLLDANAGLSFNDQQIQATVARLFPSYAPAASYAAYAAQLGSATRTSVINALQVAGLEVSTQTRDGALSEIVKDAVARSTSPTQNVQALAQLLSVLVEQSQKEQRLSASSIESAGSYYLAEASRQQTISQAEAAALRRFQATMDVTFPPLTQAQAAQLASPATPTK